MDIATAKPTVKEQQGVKHHLIDFVDLDESFSVSEYCDLAHKVIADIHNRGKLPILVGGTGLYVDSLVDNITFSPVDGDEELRNRLQNKANEYGVDYLLDMLSEFDPDSATKLGVERNVKRIIRAIEVYKTSGVTFTEYNLRSREKESPYNVVKIGLTATDRQFLYDRINRRVDIMVENGLIDEAEFYINKEHSNTSSMAIGHKELMPYFSNEASIEACLENLKMQTRRYAKRQLTWFKRDANIHFFNIDTMSFEELVACSENLIRKVLFDEKQ